MRARYDDGGPADPPEHPSIRIVEEIMEAVDKATKAGNNKEDLVSTKNDWIAYAIAYLGRAADKVYRNQREGCDYRENLIKAAGLIVSALVAHDIKANADPPDDLF